MDFVRSLRLRSLLNLGIKYLREEIKINFTKLNENQSQKQLISS